MSRDHPTPGSSSRWYRGVNVPMRAIRRFAHDVAAKFRPEKIILFGSRAGGITDIDSDVDLLIVMPIPDTRRSLATAIDLALVGIDLPADVIVVTPEEVERDKDQIGTIIRPAIHEGKVLYERAA